MKPQLIIELEQELNCVFETIDVNKYNDWNKNKISEYSIDSLGNIMEIKIQKFELNSIPNTLIQCKDLINLDLSYNQIVDITPLQELKNIQKINLSRNKIWNISPLKNLKNIELLDLSNNEIVNFKNVNHLIDNFRLISNWIGNPIDIETLYPNINLTTNVCFLDNDEISLYAYEHFLNPFLKQNRIVSYFAQNNEEVLSLFNKAQTIHILFTDIVRPRDNNTSLYKSMKNMELYPIKVLITSNPRIIEESQCSELEYIDDLKKPIITKNFEEKFSIYFEMVKIIKNYANSNDESFYNSYRNLRFEIFKNGKMSIIQWFEKNKNL